MWLYIVQKVLMLIHILEKPIYAYIQYKALVELIDSKSLPSFKGLTWYCEPFLVLLSVSC